MLKNNSCPGCQQPQSLHSREPSPLSTKQASFFKPISKKINVGSSDKNFDLRLLNTLIHHHQDAIAMSKEVMTKSSRNEVLDIASTAIVDLTAGVEQFNSWRKEWYEL